MCFVKLKLDTSYSVEESSTCLLSSAFKDVWAAHHMCMSRQKLQLTASFISQIRTSK